MPMASSIRVLVVVPFPLFEQQMPKTVLKSIILAMRMLNPR